MDAAEFSRPWWLPSAHIETIYAQRRAGSKIFYTREVAETPDNDVVAFDYLLGSAGKPALILFHGLEGSSQSPGVRAVAHWFHSRLDWTVAIPHFRSCGLMNRLPRAYHAGDTKDIAWMINYLGVALAHVSGLLAVGFSLGGNALVRWLAENPKDRTLTAAAAVCAPLYLAQCVKRIDSWPNRRIYGEYFLNSLRAKIEEKGRQYPFLIDWKRFAKVRTLADFDAIYTAPIHGFDSAEHYWDSASAGPLLGRVRTPLLCINPENDPLVPTASLPPAGPLSNGNILTPSVLIERPRHGGHVGFVGTPFPGSLEWLPSRLGAFFGVR